MSTKPISIPQNNNNNNNRNRSASHSSSDDDNNSPPLKTPVSAHPPNVSTSPVSSPILSYFFAASPSKPGSIPTPFTRNLPGAPEDPDDAHPVTAHARRMSASWAAAPRFTQTLKSDPRPSTDAAQERGVGVLRRLSMGSAFVRPQIPPSPAQPSAARRPGSPPAPAAPSRRGGSPPLATVPEPTARKARRATILSVPEGAKPRRAPSPMGERILKGHFDGFN